jgi:hypothetical protein
MQKNTTSNLLGFHYFPDSAHYTNKDLNFALEHLSKLNAGWLVLRSEATRAIPETFIAGLINKGITPIIHFPLSLPNSPSAADIKAILNAYAKWGIKYVILFDRPNDSSSWSASGWSQSNLVESFLDRFVPLANECLNFGITPVFPALTPGGSYWDLSFFKLALQALQRRGQKALLNKMALASYACTFDHPLDWGQGGTDRWPNNMPYITAANSQDQVGFNQYQWLEGIAEKVMGNPLPVILLGLDRKDLSSHNLYSDSESVDLVKQIKTFLSSMEQSAAPESPILAGNFWLFSAAAKDQNADSAWVREDGTTSAAYAVFSGTGPSVSSETKNASTKNEQSATTATTAATSDHPIQHYLLLPKYEWGISDWHLEVIKPFILKHQPTVGFSLTEAGLAKKVTVVGGEQSFSDEDLSNLRKNGSEVDRISGDGTSIATQLAER